MNRVDGEPTLSIAPTHHDTVALDLDLAARVDLPVLISAPAGRALQLARAVVDGIDGARWADVVVVRPRDAVWPTVRAAASPARSRTRTVVLKDVDGFDAAEQATLLRVLTERRTSSLRVIATTSEPLFERVATGEFDEQLFYRLNAIHICA